jgi:hypothetical protein
MAARVAVLTTPMSASLSSLFTTRAVSGLSDIKLAACAAATLMSGSRDFAALSTTATLPGSSMKPASDTAFDAKDASGDTASLRK